MATQADLDKALKEPVTSPPTGPCTLGVLKHLAMTNDAKPFEWRGALQPLLGAQVKAALIMASKAKYQQMEEGAKPVNDADTLEAFQEDSEYILEQFGEAEGPLFSLQRLCEVLLEPCRFNTRDNAAAGNEVAEATRMASLRPEKLQDSLRKCVLTAPI